MSNLQDFVIENGVLKEYTGPGGEIVIPDGVTEIGEKVFYKCATLTGVSMGDSVQVIGPGAFLWCRNLTHLALGSRVERIDLYAFADCDALEEITIPESVKRIDSQAFGECRLKRVNLAGAEAQIAATAFQGNDWMRLCAPRLPLELVPMDRKWNSALGWLQLWAEGTEFAPEITDAYTAYLKRIRKKLLNEYILPNRVSHALRWLLQQKLIKKTEIDGWIETTQRMQNAQELTALLTTYRDQGGWK